MLRCSLRISLLPRNGPWGKTRAAPVKQKKTSSNKKTKSHNHKYTSEEKLGTKRAMGEY